MNKLQIKTLKEKAKKLYPTIYRATVDHETGDVTAWYLEDFDNCKFCEDNHTKKKKIRISNARLI